MSITGRHAPAPVTAVSPEKHPLDTGAEVAPAPISVGLVYSFKMPAAAVSQLWELSASLCAHLPGQGQPPSAPRLSNGVVYRSP